MSTFKNKQIMRKATILLIVLVLTMSSLVSCVKEDMYQEPAVEQLQQDADTDWNGDSLVGEDGEEDEG
jgi:hypothetical protein